jgi:hypothetical protein
VFKKRYVPEKLKKDVEGFNETLYNETSNSFLSGGIIHDKGRAYREDGG